MIDETRRTLFQPVRVASVTAKNRVVMAPMASNFAGPDDEVTDHLLQYYAERARGGVGTIIVECSHIRKDLHITARQVGSYDDRFIPGLSRLAGAIQSEGAIALLQLLHGGAKVLALPGFQSESASPVSIRVEVTPRALTIAELGRVRKDFVNAALRAKKAGFDGIELHAAHLYLLSAFLSPFTNKRADEYGGTVRNRARLLCEIIQEIKAELGAAWPVWVRINAVEALEPGLSLEEGQEISETLAQAGADAIHASAYTLPINKKITSMVNIRVGAIPVKNTPPGPFLDFAAAIKQRVRVPVIAVGKLDDPLLAADAVRTEKCDMIALGRQLICDPYWPLKVEAGRLNEIVHCNYCNTCHTAQQRGEDLRCSQNLNVIGEPIYRKASSERRKTKSCKKKG